MFLSAVLFPTQAFCQRDRSSTSESRAESGSAADSIIRELPEIEIEADKEIYRKDHVVLKLSEENRRFGSNALDAISTLSRFVTALNSPSLLSYDRKNVFVLVDGVPSSAEMLRTYQAGDIRDVEYYDTAPARYRIYTEGPLVNVRLRRRHDMQLSAYVFAQGALTDVLTSDMATLTYADSLNLAKVTYNIGHRNNGGVSRSTVYDYPDGSSSREYTDGRDKMLSQSVSASYQRSQGSHIFNADARYRWQHDRFHYPGTVELSESGSVWEGITDKDTRISQDMFSMDLYYSYTRSQRKTLAVNLGNAFGSGDHRQYLLRDMPQPWEETGYDILNSTHNTTYNFSGDISGTYPAGNVDLNGVFRYTYRNLRQRATSGTYRSSEDSELLSLGATWSKGILTLSATGGMTAITEHTSSEDFTTIAPSGYLSLWLRGRNSWRGASASLTLSAGQSPIQGATTTDNYTYIDRRYILRGNPSLRPSDYYGTELRLQYFDPAGKWFGSVYGQLLHTRKAAVPLVFMEDDMAVRQINNIPHTNSVAFQVTGRWQPVGWIFIQPYVTGIGYFYDTPSKRIRRHSLEYGGSVTAMPGAFNIYVGAGSPKEVWRGDMYNRYSAHFYCGLSYSYSTFTFGVSYNHVTRGARFEASGDGFSYSMCPYDGVNRNLVQLNVSWLFSRGRQFRHNGKSLEGVKGDVALPTN